MKGKYPVRYFEMEDADRIYDFLMEADIQNIPGKETPQEEFDRKNWMYLDMIIAYDNCPSTSAQAYNRAKQEAFQASMNAQDKVNLFYQMMQREYFDKVIQQRWNTLKQNKTRTSVLSHRLYQDYLDAFDLQDYVEYSPTALA